MRLSIFAYHVSQLMNENAPVRFALHPCDGVTVEVRIEPSKLDDNKAGDQVYLNGKWCGNRHGGVQEFVAIVCAARPEIVYD